VSDVHGAAYNRSPEVNGQCGDLPWQATDDYGGYGGMAPTHQSTNDGDNDTDDIGTYSPFPVAPSGTAAGFLTVRQGGYGSGGWS
jgi:hypothetical protein